MNSNVTLITPTGARPEAFELCISLVKRQTFKEWHWIVVDDGPIQLNESPSWIALASCGRCTYLRPTPIWASSNTQKRNLQAALAACHTEWICFIEDDDWYHPEYLERSLKKANEGYSLVGEANANYYHLPSSSFRMMGNRIHASLAQTIMNRSLVPCLIEILAKNEHSFDILLWQAAWRISKPFLFPTSTHAVGIKGMPGRPGLGIGHRPGNRWGKDTSCSVLRDLIGADVEFYANYLGRGDS